MQLPPELNYLQPRLYPDLVRVGSFCDGGYLVPQSALSELEAVLSFGVSVDWNFEKQLRSIRSDLDIHCYDHTVGAQLFAKVAGRAILDLLRGRGSVKAVSSRFSVWRDYARFFRGRTVHFKERVFNRRFNTNDATIDTIFARVQGKRHVLVKVDIEGDEYRVIPDLLRYAGVIDALVIEFHDTDPLRLVFQHQVGLLLQHFGVAHLHGNNYLGQGADGLPDAVEVTFVSKRLGVPVERRDRLPIPDLDSPCNPASAEVELQFSAT
jgi:hypothetical protein